MSAETITVRIGLDAALDLSKCLDVRAHLTERGLDLRQEGQGVARSRLTGEYVYEGAKLPTVDGAAP